MSVTDSTNALPVRYKLDEYIVERVLGIGGFGITYLARDTRLGAKVAVKEYFPQAFAHRERGFTIQPNPTTDEAGNYRWGLQEFLKEARALAQFKHANIVRVLRFLEANGTAYMVMEYEEGESLSDYLSRHGGFLNESALLNIFLPVLTGLQAVHDAGLLHLDIKPDNIYLRRSGPPMLIDFGAARQRQGDRRSEKVALTPGYAALEQYPGHGDLGPWSDVYSIGATVYRCITGREPVDSAGRVSGLKKLHIDPLIPATRFDRPHYSTHIRSCVDAALTLKAGDRPRTAFALQNGLMGKDMNATRQAASNNAYNRGQGFIGVVPIQDEPRKKRLMPRGPLERLLVFAVFSAVMVVAPVQIMLATGHMSEAELYSDMDSMRAAAIEKGRRATRYVEEKVFGITRPPDYVPVAPSYHVVARTAPPARAAETKPVEPFDVNKKLAVSVELQAPVMSLAFLQNGQQLALALDNGAIELRNAKTGALVRSFAPANGEPGTLAASPDGRLLAFGTAEHSVQVWDMDQGRFLIELAGHADALIALAFAPDGKTLASAGRDQRAMLWDVEQGRVLCDLARPKSEPTTLAFSPDGATLAVGDSSGGIRYWSLKTLRDIAYVPTRDQPLAAVAYSPDGRWFAVGSEQGFLGLWDVSGKREDRQLAAAPGVVHALSFSPDSKWLIVAGSDASLQLWDVESAQLAQHYDGANRQTYALALAAKTSEIAAAGNDPKLTLWR